MKKTNFLLVLIACLLFSGCNKLNDSTYDFQTESMEILSIVDPSDPNLNPSWDWTVGSHMTIYYINSQGGNVSQSITLPWFTSGNPMAVVDPDINKEDGWVLAYKDVGTADRHVDLPFFALYNKYRGTLRFFVYNAQRMAANYFRGEIMFRETQYSTSALSFVADESHSTMDSFRQDESQTVISFANTYNAWINFDFSLANYDPNNSINTIVDFNIYTVNESEITLESTEFSLVHEYLATNQPGTTKSGLSNALEDGQKYLKSFDDLRKNVKEATATSSDKFKSSKALNALSAIANEPYLNAIPILGSALGIINSFIGGQTNPFPWQMMKFQGKLKLSGTLQSTIPRFTISFSLKKEGNLNAGFYQPVNVSSFGVFNLQRLPQINLTNFTENWSPGSGQYPDAVDYYHEAEFSLINNNGNLIINNDANMTLVSTRIKIIDHIGHNVNISDGYYIYDDFRTWDDNTKFSTRFILNDTSPNVGASPFIPEYIGVELVFSTNQPSTLDDKIVFIKVYKLKG